MFVDIVIKQSENCITITEKDYEDEEAPSTTFICDGNGKINQIVYTHRNICYDKNQYNTTEVTDKTIKMIKDNDQTQREFVIVSSTCPSRITEITKVSISSIHIKLNNNIEFHINNREYVITYYNGSKKIVVRHTYNPQSKNYNICTKEYNDNELYQEKLNCIYNHFGILCAAKLIKYNQQKIAQETIYRMRSDEIVQDIFEPVYENDVLVSAKEVIEYNNGALSKKIIDPEYKNGVLVSATNIQVFENNQLLKTINKYEYNIELQLPIIDNTIEYRTGEQEIKSTYKWIENNQTLIIESSNGTEQTIIKPQFDNTNTEIFCASMITEVNKKQKIIIDSYRKFGRIIHANNMQIIPLDNSAKMELAVVSYEARLCGDKKIFHKYIKTYLGEKCRIYEISSVYETDNYRQIYIKIVCPTDNHPINQIKSADQVLITYKSKSGPISLEYNKVAFGHDGHAFKEYKQYNEIIEMIQSRIISAKEFIVTNGGDVSSYTNPTNHLASYEKYTEINNGRINRILYLKNDCTTEKKGDFDNNGELYNGTITTTQSGSIFVDRITYNEAQSTIQSQIRNVIEHVIYNGQENTFTITSRVTIKNNMQFIQEGSFVYMPDLPEQDRLNCILPHKADGDQIVIKNIPDQLKSQISYYGRYDKSKEFICTKIEIVFPDTLHPIAIEKNPQINYQYILKINGNYYDVNQCKPVNFAQPPTKQIHIINCYNDCASIASGVFMTHKGPVDSYSHYALLEGREISIDQEGKTIDKIEYKLRENCEQLQINQEEAKEPQTQQHTYQGTITYKDDNDKIFAKNVGVFHYTTSSGYALLQGAYEEAGVCKKIFNLNQTNETEYTQYTGKILYNNGDYEVGTFHVTQNECILINGKSKIEGTDREIELEPTMYGYSGDITNDNSKQGIITQLLNCKFNKTLFCFNGTINVKKKVNQIETDYYIITRKTTVNQFNQIHQGTISIRNHDNTLSVCLEGEYAINDECAGDNRYTIIVKLQSGNTKKEYTICAFKDQIKIGDKQVCIQDVNQAISLMSWKLWNHVFEQFKSQQAFDILPTIAGYLSPNDNN